MSALLGAVAGAAAATMAIVFWLRTRRTLTTPTERAVHEALHTASLAARSLREGLDSESASAAVPHLRRLTSAPAMLVAGPDGDVLAWDCDPDLAARGHDDTGPHTGDDAEQRLTERARATAARAIDGARRVLDSDPGLAGDGARAVVAQPLTSEHGGVLGALAVVTADEPSPGLLGALGEVARYASGQIELADLDASRARLDRAEVRALRAQISPHFIYNALNTVASFVRTDPARARELILEFADFTRYSFRSAGEYTLLSDELRNIDRYLTLERARFGQSLQVVLRIAPEVLGVVLPFLALQPLVENAVRHGIAGKPEGGTVTITATDEGTDCVVSVEDDGVGMDPELLRSGSLDTVDASRGVKEAAHVGLANVDDRLRAAFGDDYGLVVETAPGAGTKVSMRVPKYRPGIRP